MEVPISIVSVGPSRDQTIIVEDPIHGPKRALLNSNGAPVTTHELHNKEQSVNPS